MLSYVPKRGIVLYCDFGKEDGVYKPPEMIKKRPVIILSKLKLNYQTTTVIPLSSKRNTKKSFFEIELDSNAYPLLKKQSWAKCDMICTVSSARLEEFVSNGKKISLSIHPMDLERLGTALMEYLQLINPCNLVDIDV